MIFNYYYFNCWHLRFEVLILILWYLIDCCNLEKEKREMILEISRIKPVKYDFSLILILHSLNLISQTF